MANPTTAGATNTASPRHHRAPRFTRASSPSGSAQSNGSPCDTSLVATSPLRTRRSHRRPAMARAPGCGQSRQDRLQFLPKPLRICRSRQVLKLTPPGAMRELRARIEIGNRCLACRLRRDGLFQPSQMMLSSAASPSLMHLPISIPSGSWSASQAAMMVHVIVMAIKRSTGRHGSVKHRKSGVALLGSGTQVKEPRPGRLRSLCDRTSSSLLGRLNPFSLPSKLRRVRLSAPTLRADPYE
jgi:hypothetical protein